MLAALRGADPAARIDALSALASGDAPVTFELCRALIILLSDDQKEIRRRAADALSRAVGDPECRALLDRGLVAPDDRQRWGACFALGRAGVLERPVVDAALAALAADDGDVRWAAAGIVCRAAASDPKLLDVVRTVVRSGAAEQRKMALYCLRDAGVTDDTAFLSSLRDADRGVRLAALSGLRGCVSQTAAEAVVRVMEEDVDDGVRRAAAATLERRDAVNATVRERIARALASVGTGSARFREPPPADPKRNR